MSSMKINSQSGFVSGTLISLIVTSVFLAGSLGFGAWAFLSRQDYKNNSDKKALTAANERQKLTEAADAVKYAEAAKNPYKTHKSPDQFGAVTVVYPKTWSAYVGETGSESSVVNNYYHPDVVPSVNKDNAHALRIQVVEQSYDQVMKNYQSEVKSGKLVASPYALTKVPNIVGTRLNGEVERGKQGSLVIVPIRNMTLKVWTESPNYLADFNKIILPNLSFLP